jgi:hypothetical protein
MSGFKNILGAPLTPRKLSHIQLFPIYQHYAPKQQVVKSVRNIADLGLNQEISRHNNIT